MTTTGWIPGIEVAAESRLSNESAAAARSTSNQLWIYLAPFILITGICGNTLVLVVMSQGRMRGTSTCVYLLTMAIADLVAITTGVVPDWLTAQGIITIKEVDPFLCKMEKFLSYTSADTSIWACVVFTIDRFVAVCFPMDNVRICPPHNAKFHAVAVFLAAVCKNLHVFATRGQKLSTENNVTYIVSNCKSPNEVYGYFEEYIRPWIAFTVVNLVPFIIIVFCNLFIIRAMIRLRRSHRQSVIVSSRDSSTTIHMTVLCLSASICFLVCVTPSMIILIGRPHWLGSSNYEVAKAIGNLIFYINHSINFFLYCVTGEKFRAELRALISRNNTSGPRSSIYGSPNDLVFSNKLQNERLSQLNGNRFSLYASAPCIGEKATIRWPAEERTFGDNEHRTMGDRLKSSSDEVILSCPGRQDETVLRGKQLRI